MTVEISPRELALKLILHPFDIDKGFAKWSFINVSKSLDQTISDKENFDLKELEREVVELTQADKIEAGIAENNEKYTSLEVGQLSRVIGKIGHLKTFIPDSKQYPYYTIAQEVKDEIKKILSESIQISGNEIFRFSIIAFGDSDNLEETAIDKRYLNLEVINVSADIVDVLQNLGQEVVIQEANISDKIRAASFVVDSFIKHYGISTPELEKILHLIAPKQQQMYTLEKDRYCLELEKTLIESIQKIRGVNENNIIV